MAMMKAARVHEWGSSENVFVDDVPVPEPKSGEVLIRVRASSINPVDWKAQLGYMKDWFHLPFTPGWDAAGEIAAVGEEASSEVSADASEATAEPQAIGTDENEGHAESSAEPSEEKSASETRE